MLIPRHCYELHSCHFNLNPENNGQCSVNDICYIRQTRSISMDKFVLQMKKAFLKMVFMKMMKEKMTAMKAGKEEKEEAPEKMSEGDKVRCMYAKLRGKTYHISVENRTTLQIFFFFLQLGLISTVCSTFALFSCLFHSSIPRVDPAWTLSICVCCVHSSLHASHFSVLTAMS